MTSTLWDVMAMSNTVAAQTPPAKYPTCAAHRPTALWSLRFRTRATGSRVVLSTLPQVCTRGNKLRAVTTVRPQFLFPSGPCPPTGVQVSLLCQSNVGNVSWTAALNAESYVATAISSDGFRHSCTTNSTSCTFLDLYCGKNYSITVVTVQRGCWSDPSTPVPLRSGEKRRCRTI